MELGGRSRLGVMQGFGVGAELWKAESGTQAELGIRIGEAASLRSEEMPSSLSLSCPMMQIV
jgi:hypothetical protein